MQHLEACPAAVPTPCIKQQQRHLVGLLPHPSCTPCRLVQCVSSLTGKALNASSCPPPKPQLTDVQCTPAVAASCKTAPPPPPGTGWTNITVACPEGVALDIDGSCCQGVLADVAAGYGGTNFIMPCCCGIAVHASSGCMCAPDAAGLHVTAGLTAWSGVFCSSELNHVCW